MNSNSISPLAGAGYHRMFFAHPAVATAAVFPDKLSQKAPTNALIGNWNGNVNVNENNPQNSNPNLGARRVLRVYLLSW